jgi:hypothetical protein
MNRISSFFIDVEEPAQSIPGCAQLLARCRCAIRLREFDLAESFLMEAGLAMRFSAPCLNLMGLIAESRGEWHKAKRFWGRSIRADRTYQPPRQNLRRYFELFQFGSSSLSVAFGDEPQFMHQEVCRER